MRKILLLLLIIVVVFSACKKDEDHVFDKSPDERINEAIDSYQSTLTGAANGWKALIKTDSGKGSAFSFYFKFSTGNRVKMFSDFDSVSAATSQESSYRLKAQQQPTLIFDTYSYVHVLADPNEGVVLTDNFILFSDVNGGPLGQGLSSDFEFIFDNEKIKPDTIELVGKVHNTTLILTKATQAEEDAYNNGQLASGTNLNKILTYFKRLTIGTQLYDVTIDPRNRQVIFSRAGAGGNLQTFITGYYFVAGGIVFTTPFSDGNQTISGFSNITWNVATQTANFTVNNTAATLTSVAVPLKVDVAAPRRWYDYAINHQNLYWVSFSGFHVNGVDDAFDIRSLRAGDSTYLYLLYWPKPNPRNDLFAPVFLDAARTGVDIFYATLPRAPSFKADGRAVFSPFVFDFGPPLLPYPINGPAAQTRTLLYDSSGYYFVQTSETTYDMVSALDLKSWITWEFIF